MSRRPAFTLIELLVVVAILALLVSILVPSLKDARELAKRSVCMANQRSMRTALALYLQENDSRQPLMATYTNAHAEMEYLFPVAMAQYMGLRGISERTAAPTAVDGDFDSSGRFQAYCAGVVDNGPVRNSVFFCPSETSQWKGPYFYRSGDWWLMLTNYAAVWSGWNQDHKGNPSTWVPTRGSAFSNPRRFMGTYLSTRPFPADTPVFGHTGQNQCTYTQINQAVPAQSQWYFSFWGTPGTDDPTHGGSLPISWLDGHVELVTGKDAYEDFDSQPHTVDGSGNVFYNGGKYGYGGTRPLFYPFVNLPNAYQWPPNF